MTPKVKATISYGPTNELITEDAVAQRFADIHVRHLRYCRSTGAWFEFMGQAWREDRTERAFHYARELVRNLAKEHPDRVRYVSSKVSFAGGVERFAKSDPDLAVTIEAWDKDPFLLGTPGGTVDLRTALIRVPRPEDGITRLTACAPADTADCPLWLKFLDQTFGGDPELIRFIQQWLGYSLTGDTREQALVFGHGPGGNGKGVLLNTVSGIALEYAVTAPMETFAAASGDRHTTDLAMLRGARIVSASETEEGRAWAESRIKSLTGGDPVTARFMRQDNFTFRPCFKLFLVGNHKPTLRNVDDAMQRRLNIVPFACKPAKPDLQMEAKLRPEWPAILRWMIDGCLDWQQSGLIRPEIVRSATADYFTAQDLFGQWLYDCCDAEPGNTYQTETSSALFVSWCEYAKRAGEAPGPQRTFADSMLKRGFEQHRTPKARTYRGVRLKLQDGFG
jgi:putative DNA primase/helicase